MNVMNVSAQLGEENAFSTGVQNASLGKKQWETTTRQQQHSLSSTSSSQDAKKGYIDSVTSTSSSHADKSGKDASRLRSSSGRSRLQASFPTEEGDEEELHNEVFRRNVVTVGGARKSEALDQIRGGSSMMPEIPNEMPGLSIITWEEFVTDPSILHNLFSLDKEEFIQFDNTIINNLFHDSRMEPPILGAPSGDNLSWQIFVESYSQLRHVRDVMTSRISVILVDLVKPNNEGTAACVIAINPMDDHIRRVLHLTLSRAMESVFNSRCFSVEINLNNDITAWCRTVLQTECQVVGGRIVITNGEEPQAFCLVESPPKCVVCFPVWLYRRLKYLIFRRRRYDDTMVEFEGANFFLCTRSETLRQYSESAQLTKGDRLIHKNIKAVTMATQTLNTSCTSLKSDLSVEDVDEASDNDVIKRRHVANERGHDLYGFDNPSYMDKEEELPDYTTTAQADYVDKHSKHDETPTSVNDLQPPSLKNTRLRDEDDSRIKQQQQQQQQQQAPIIRNRNKKSDHVEFAVDQNQRQNQNRSQSQKMATKEVDIVASANSTNMNEHGNIAITPRGEDRFMKNTKNFDELLREDVNNKSFESVDEQVLTPRSRAAFIKRPFTPFIKKPTKDKKKDPKSPRHPDKVDSVSELRLPLDQLLSTPSPADKDSHVNNKTEKMHKKIKDLKTGHVSSSNSQSSVQTFGYNDHINDGIITPETPRREVVKKLPSEMPVPVKRKVRETPVIDVQITPRGNPVFPYTSELLDFNTARDALEKYGADLSKSKSKKKQVSTDDMLFQPRLNLDGIEPDRNCFSDQDISDSDVTDLENENEGAMSDTEGLRSARYIPVPTPRTLSLNPAVQEIINKNKNNSDNINNNNNNKSDLDSDLEITDCDDTEDENTNYNKQMSSPRILPGAQAAHQLRAASAGARSRGGSAKSRDYIPPSAQMNNRRGGNQNDSRRKYLALNSLRRKAYKLALQSQVRSQSSKRPSSAAQLVSYSPRKEPHGSVVAVISAV